MLGTRPRRQVRAALAHQLERQGRPEPMDLRQVDAEDGMQGSPSIEGQGVRRLGGVPGWWQLTSRRRSQSPKPRQDCLDALITGRNLLLVSIVQFHGLGQSEDVLLPIIAD